MKMYCSKCGNRICACPAVPPKKAEPALPEGYEMFEGKPRKVINGDRVGWWRFHNHYDRDGYCDNPARGY